MNDIQLEEAGRQYFLDLRDVLIAFLTTGTWNDIEETFVRVSLEWRPDLEPGWGKPKYVRRVLAEIPEDKIVALAKRCIHAFPVEDVYEIQDALWWYQSAEISTLSHITRSQLLKALDGYKLHASMDPKKFLMIFPQFVHLRHSGQSLYYADNNQLMRRSEFANTEDPGTPCSYREFFEESDFGKWSDPRVFDFFERLVHPEVREENEQVDLVAVLNEQLKRDGFELKCTDYISGYPVYSVVATSKASSEPPKYLVFASSGPKPEIGFKDIVGNKIAILKYEESCLVYDRPIDPNSGLSWEDMVRWWENSKYVTQVDGEDPRKSLGRRLLESLVDSPPERYLFEAYFRVFQPIYKTNLPALIPQVYVHYDPITIAMLIKRGDKQRFERQRMDFLLLLPGGSRIILEIDGKQHYSRNGEPCPDTYAVTARSHRVLHLLGYDVYRFAGIELNSKEKAHRIAQSFFEQLFKKHGII